MKKARKNECLVIMITHNFKDINVGIRNNILTYFIGSGISDKQLQDFHSEFFSNIDYDVFKRMKDKACEERF